MAKIEDKEALKNAMLNLEQHLRDRVTANQTDFAEGGRKQSGVTLGYVANRLADRKKHILKQAYKKPLTQGDILTYSKKDSNFKDYYVKKFKNIIINQYYVTWKQSHPNENITREELNRSFDESIEKTLNTGQTDQLFDYFTNYISKEERVMRRDMMTEYISGRVYERFLYDRAPKINLAATSQEDPVIFVTSKFFDNFQTLTELTGHELKPENNGKITQDHESLKNIEGFEKVIAACNIAGESDYHASNLGVVPALDDDGQPRTDSQGNPIYNAVKIDHGRSSLMYDNEESLRDNLAKTMGRFGYNEIKFNVSKYKESLAQMANISDDEIDALSAKASHELAKNGMIFDEDLTPEKISQEFANNFKKRRDVVKDLVKSLEIIEKIGPVEEKWKDSNWLYDIRDQDPVVWAIKKDKKIEGQDPITWAAQNDRKISLFNKDGTRRKIDPIVYAVKNKKEIDGKDPIAWAALNGKQIEGQNPLAWAMNNETKIGGKEIKTWIDENRADINANNEEFLKRYDLENEISNNSSTKPILNILFSDIDKNLSREETLDICAIKLARLARTGSPIPKDTLVAGLKFIEEKRKLKNDSMFDDKSDVYKNIMGKSSDYIALKIREAKAKGTSSDLEGLNLNAIIRKSPAALAEKILRIAEKVNEQEGNPPSNIKTTFIKFKNFCKGITFQNFNDQKLTKVFEEFKNVSNVQETKQHIQINDKANIRKTLEEAQEVMKVKTNNKVIGQLYKINHKGQSSGHSR